MVQALIALNADVQAANNEYVPLCSCIDLDDCEVDSRDHLRPASQGHDRVANCTGLWL
jgi:hypothetical protein